MDTFTIAAAARLCHCDRRTLQRAIHTGRLHLDAQHRLSREALMATGYLVDDAPHVTPQDAPQAMPQVTPQDAPLLALLERLAGTIADLTQEVRQLHASLSRAPQAMPQRTPQATPQETPHTAPPTPGAYDVQTAVARIQTLHRQGLSTRAIAAQLNAEGMPTRHGQPWGGASVGYLLRRHGAG